MRHHDIIHGITDIRDDLILELVDTDALRRLESIHQAGATAYVYPRRCHTRFDHSVGVMLLLRRLRASWREQVAGLLHDISHTAFSHVSDWVFPTPDAEGSYHETIYENLLWSSEVPTVLAAYGLAVADVLEETRYPLLEQPAPALCADRLDYFLRDALVEKLITSEEVSRCLLHLVVHEGHIVVNDLAVARWLATRYLETDQRIWSNPLDICAYQVLAEAIQLALADGFIVREMLVSTDDDVMALLRSSPNPAIQKRLQLLSPRATYAIDSEDYASEDYASEDYDSEVTIDKVRAVDPPVLVGKQVTPLSELDEGFRETLEEHRARQGQVVRVRARRA